MSFEEQNKIMFKEKKISEHNFGPNRGYCVDYPSNLFCNVCSFENWGVFSDIPQFQPANFRLCDVFRPIVQVTIFDGL